MSFPLYYYDEKSNNELQLFDMKNIRYNNISSVFLNKVKQQYNNNEITVEDVFKYTYAILYSNDYGNIKMHVDNIIRIMTKLKTFVIFHRNAK